VCVRYARLGVVGLSLACSALAGGVFACNALFDIHDPPLSSEPGRGGSGGTPDDVSSGGQSGSGGASGNGGTAAGTGGTGELEDAGGRGGTSVEPTVTSSGTVRRFEEPQREQPGALLSAYVGSAMPVEAEFSPGTGRFTLAAGSPNSMINLESQYPASLAPGVPLALLQARIRVPLGVGSTKSIDPPVVSYDWLTRTVDECAGVRDSATPLQAYFGQRATLLIQISDAGGGVAGIDRDQVQVTLTNGGVSRVNRHELRYDAPGVPDDNPTFVCVLEARAGDDAGAGEQLVGGTQTQTTSLGRFVVFRAQNAQSTGSGEVEVSVPGYATRSINLRQSGQIGVLLLGADW
jgi:hypothetical protein